MEPAAPTQVTRIAPQIQPQIPPQSERARAPARWLDGECSTLVAQFWHAGGDEPFPRTLLRPLSFALPIAVCALPHLTTAAVAAWLRARGRDFPFDGPSRPLHGCLLARNGHGVIFVDAVDSPAEQRFTLVHEIAHYLVDYLLPRRRGLDRLGREYLDVLDGVRPPTVPERLALLIHGLSLQPQVNLMERSAAQGGALALWTIEARADRVALALLAPPEALLDALPAGTLAERRAAATARLQSNFGLPPGPAQRYAAELLLQVDGGDSWIESLRDVARSVAQRP